jgi:hypothetical protein
VSPSSKGHDHDREVIHDDLIADSERPLGGNLKPVRNGPSPFDDRDGHHRPDVSGDPQRRDVVGERRGLPFPAPRVDPVDAQLLGGVRHVGPHRDAPMPRQRHLSLSGRFTVRDDLGDHDGRELDLFERMGPVTNSAAGGAAHPRRPYGGTVVELQDAVGGVGSAVLASKDRRPESQGNPVLLDDLRRRCFGHDHDGRGRAERGLEASRELSHRESSLERRTSYRFAGGAAERRSDFSRRAR